MVRSLFVRGLITGAALHLTACGRSATPPTAPASPASQASTPAAPLADQAEPSPKNDPVSAQEAQISQPAEPAPTEPAPTEPARAAPHEIHFSEHYPPDASVSLLAWKKEQHVGGPTFEQRCWPLRTAIGSPPAPGLLCLVTNTKPLFTLARIYRQDGSNLREVWSATVFTYMNWLELTPIVAADGQSLELYDRTPGSCQAALSEYHAKQSARVAPPSGELLEPACRKVGKYVYERRAFRYQEPPPGSRPTVPFEFH